VAAPLAWPASYPALAWRWPAWPFNGGSSAWPFLSASEGEEEASLMKISYSINVIIIY